MFSVEFEKTAISNKFIAKRIGHRLGKVLPDPENKNWKGIRKFLNTKALTNFMNKNDEVLKQIAPDHHQQASRQGKKFLVSMYQEAAPKGSTRSAADIDRVILRRQTEAKMNAGSELRSKAEKAWNEHKRKK